jgi:hypothetical protein
MVRGSSSLAALVVGLSLPLSFLTPAASASTIPAYTLVGSFPLSGSAWDILPDGRVVSISGSTISAQTAPNAGTFAPIGSVPAGTVASFGASFLRASPDGSRLAIGDNVFGAGARVHFVSTAALNTAAPTPTTSILSGNYDADWASNSVLYVSGFGTGSQVFRIDADALTTRTVITGIGDGSGGVAVSGGTLYTGIGFDAGGTTTGQIRGFDLAALDSAITPVNFAAGAFAATILSAASLDTDRFGNLLAAGADFSAFPAVTGYASVLDLPGGNRLDLSPAGTGRSYRVRFNHATDELLVVSGGTAYRYAVPAPGAAAALAAASLLAARRRRHA